ncbi:MAG: ABC transporter permease [Bacteroidales bacterium]|nr:ABC transporter permease [Bacteroidales bacterium]
MTLGPFIYKETLHVLRDRRMLFVVLAIPVVQMLLFGFAISTEINNIDVAVAYQEYDADIRQAIERLNANPYTTVMGQVDQTNAYHTLQAGKADAVVVFRNGEDLQIIADASNPNIAQSSTAYLQAIISGDKAQELPVDLHYLYNPLLKSSYNFAPGIMGMLFLLVCALMTAVAIVREKETGTMELLLASPVKSWQIVISKMVPFFVLSCVDLALILIIGKYLLEVPMTAGMWPIILFSLLYIVLSLAFGLLVSTFSNSQIMAMLICGMVMIMPVVMLSGMIFPVDNLPVVLAQISYIVPARWYIDAMRKLMVEGLELSLVLDDLIVLSVMAIALMAVAMHNFKNRL